MDNLRLTPIDTLKVNNKKSDKAWAYEDKTGLQVLYHQAPGVIVLIEIPKRNVLAYANRFAQKET